METKQNKTLKVGTDFSGIGSPEIALKNLGINFKSMFACDFDKYAKQSYLANHKTENFYDDITTRNHEETPYVDLYIAGFPCQAFSMAGKRKGFDDTRGTLFFDLLKYLKAKRPKYFILENVKGLISHNKGQTFAVILDCLGKVVNKQYSFTNYDDGLNYNIYHKVLNTKDFGIPQNRERIFIVGFREDKHSFKWPKPFELKLKLKDMLQDNPDSKYNLSERAKAHATYTGKKKGVVINLNRGGQMGVVYSKDTEVMSCLTAVDYKNPKKILEVDDKYYLSKRMIKGIEKSNFRERKPISVNGICKTLKIGGDTPCFDVDEKHLETKKNDLSNSITTSQFDSIIQIGNIVDTGNWSNPQRGRVYSKEGICPSLNCMQGGGLEPKILDDKIVRLEDLKLKVNKRVNETPKEINEYLRKYKNDSIKNIAKKINLPITKVEHYFRTDKSRAIPDPKTWNKLKYILKFDDTYDKQVTEFEEKLSVYDTTKRLYDTKGISATLQTNEGGFYKVKKRIRKLTPLECLRLQGFPDEFYFKCKEEGLSDSQLYKQAGNSMTSDVIYYIIKEILKNGY